MTNSTLTFAEQSVLQTVKQEHLTSFEILKKVDNVSLILSLYNILDKLKNKGLIQSYVKNNQTYHFAA